jgi:hypothetical protein
MIAVKKIITVLQLVNSLFIIQTKVRQTRVHFIFNRWGKQTSITIFYGIIYDNQWLLKQNNWQYISNSKKSDFYQTFAINSFNLFHNEIKKCTIFQFKSH